MNDVSIDFITGTATFVVNIESGVTKTTYKGMFKVKCVLSPLEYIYADSFYRELIGKNNPQFVADYVSQLCYALSQLKYRVIECPDWFKNKENGINGSSVDDNILLYILDKTVDCELQYREGIKERYEKARESVRKAIDDKELTSGKEEEKKENTDLE